MKKIFYTFIILISLIFNACSKEENIIDNGRIEDSSYIEIESNQFYFELKKENGDIFKTDIYLLDNSTQKKLTAEFIENSKNYMVECTKNDRGSYVIKFNNQIDFEILNNKIEIAEKKKIYADGSEKIVNAVKIPEDLKIVEKNENKNKLELTIKLTNTKNDKEYKFQIKDNEKILKEAKFENGVSEGYKFLNVDLLEFDSEDYEYIIYEDTAIIKKGNFIIFDNNGKKEILPESNIIIEIKTEETEINEEVEDETEEEIIVNKDVLKKVNFKLYENDMILKNYFDIEIELIDKKNIDVDNKKENEITFKIPSSVKEESIKLYIKIKPKSNFIEFENKMDISFEKNLKIIKNNESYDIYDGNIKKENIVLTENNELNIFHSKIKIDKETDSFKIYSKSNIYINILKNQMQNGILRKDKNDNIVEIIIINKNNVSDFSLIFFDSYNEDTYFYLSKNIKEFDNKGFEKELKLENQKEIIKFSIQEYNYENSIFYKLKADSEAKDYDRKAYLYYKENGEYKYLKTFSIKDLKTTSNNLYDDKNSIYFDKYIDTDELYILTEEKNINENGIRRKISPSIYTIYTETNIKKINDNFKNLLNNNFEKNILGLDKIFFDEYYYENNIKYIYLNAKIFLKNLHKMTIENLYRHYSKDYTKENFTLDINIKSENEDIFFSIFDIKDMMMSINDKYSGKKNEDFFINLAAVFLEKNINMLNLKKQNKKYEIEGKIVKNTKEKINLNEDVIKYKTINIDNKELYVPDEIIDKNIFEKDINFKETLYYLDKKEIEPIATDLTFYLGMGVMDRYTAKGETVFNDTLKEEFSNYNFDMPETYTKIYQVYNDNSVYAGAKTSKIRIKQGDVTKGYGNFGQNYQEKKIEKIKITEVKGVDAYKWEAKEFIAAATFLIDIYYFVDRYEDIKGSEAWKKVPESVRWIVEILSKEKKSKDKTALNLLVAGLNIYTLYNLEYEDMWKKKVNEMKYYYTDDFNWTNIYSESDKYNLTACIGDNASNIYKLTPEERAKLIEKMLNPNDVNYCNIWDMYIYVGEKVSGKNKIKDIIPTPYAKAPGSVKIRIINEIQTLEGHTLFLSAYENKEKLDETTILNEVESEDYKAVKKGSQEDVLEKGWYKLKYKIEKIGTTDIEDPNGWGVIAPINANVYKADENAYFHIDDESKKFNCEFVNKKIAVEDINSSKENNVYSD